MRIRSLLVVLLFAAGLAQAKGTLTGTVTSSKDGEPIVGANVVVVGSRAGASTDLDGRYRIVVDQGSWDIQVSHISYEALEKKQVVVIDNEETVIDLQCVPFVLKGEEVVIQGRIKTNNENALLTARKKADTVNDAISSEQMSKSGDGNVASALKRVTGVTIQNGKDIFVRGMGDRYSNVQLNGSALPSTNPDRREVPADLLSSSLVDNVTVQKTYTADQPGEFGGGSVQIKTREFPDQRSLKVGMSTSFNTTSTGKDFLSYEGGDTDFLGYDDGTRELPGNTNDANGDGRMSSEEGMQAASAFQNNWTPGMDSAPINQSWGLSYADRYELFNERELGLVTSFSWSHKTDNRNGDYRNLYQPGALASDYERISGSQKSGLSAMVNVFFKLSPRTTVGLRNLYVNQAEDKATRVSGSYYNSDGDYRQDILKFERRSMLSNSLELKQDLPMLPEGRVKARLGLSSTRREEPDTRNTHYAFNDVTRRFEIVLTQRGNYHFFSEQDDRILDSELGLEFRPLQKLGLKTGLQYMNRDRTFDARQFTYDNSGTSSPYPTELRGTDAESALGPDVVAAGQLRFFESTRGSDSYEAVQNRFAAYVSGEINVTPTLEVNLGVRLEQDAQDLNDEELTNYTDVLPALNTTWRITNDTALRGAASMTLARPEFRELADFYFTDFIGGRTTYGNSEIERTRITNTDLRYEYYFGIGELAAVGAFYKHFDKPIELRHRNSQQPEVVYDNVDSADLFGLEFELRKNLNRQMQLSGNLTLIHSEVNYADDVHNQANRDRALYGQSPYSLNLNYYWKIEELNSTLNLAYNTFGKRISSVGSLNQGDDEYEQPFHKLDLVASREWGAWTTKLSLSNLLDDDVEFVQSGIVTDTYSPGRTVSLGFSYEL